MRIAMWSGPRNISTAMMRAWGNRPDTFVCDEPLYAHYLERTGVSHPGAAEVVAHHETDWRKVVEWLQGPIPDGRTVFYQKHMAHHLLPDIDRVWIGAMTNCFLIRTPREMLSSLDKRYANPTIEDTGLPQQVELFRRVREETGSVPPVLDARDVLEDPAGLLSALCDRLGLPFTAAMLSWAPGPRATDGIWARHWYDAVESSTGFRPYRPKDEPLPPELTDVCAEAETHYATLFEHRLEA
jgi:hypothetical protein